MQTQLIGWLGVVIFVCAVAVTIAADFFRQRDVDVSAVPVSGVRPPGGRVFWLTVSSVLLTVFAAVATVVRLATLA